MPELSPKVRENFIKQIKEAKSQRRKSNLAFLLLSTLLIDCIIFLVTHIH